MAGTYNISLPAGDTLTRTFTWDDENGDPINLDGFTAELLVFDEEGNIVLEANTETAGGIDLEPTSGGIVLEKQTAGVAAGCYQYTLVMTSAGGVVTTLLEGSFDLE